MARTGAVFPTVRSEGGLLPPDLLQRIVEADPELKGFEPTDYGLGPREPVREAIARSWQRARAYWAAFRAATDDLPASASGVTETREQWVLPLLRALGYEIEFRAAAQEVGGRRYPISHRADSVPVHVVSCRQDVDAATRAVDGQPRVSPHGLVQEYLNRADGALYGLVTNGLVLRLLRDNPALSRLSYLELDLKGMFDGGVYADFVLLWLTLHRTRLPALSAEPSACWLERWRGRAETQGARAMGELRRGVEEALTALGTGLLAHPANEPLRERLRHGHLTTTDFYAQLLRLLYRLLFLLVAEERDLLFPAGTSERALARYLGYYGVGRLRDLARRHLDDTRHDDWWRGLTVLFDVLAGRRAGLDLPALGGGLFDADSCPDLDGADDRPRALIANAALARAITHLSVVRVDRRWRRVNYRDIDVEELGGVYEGLLERQPHVVVDAANPHFELVGSGQRKQTGSYYTPASLVRELIRPALAPVIADRLAGAATPSDKERALLEIAVCDSAVGSGHFLFAAAREIADALARVRTGDREPSPEEKRAATRDTIRRCLYGVDMNPLAVDLCRLSLWLEGHDAGRPLTFLDHHVKLGNSLIGAPLGETTPLPDRIDRLLAAGLPDGAFEPVAGDDKALATAAKKRNRQERAAQLSFGSDASAWGATRLDLAGGIRAIDAMAADTDAAVRRQRAAYADYRSGTLDPARAPLDAWTAAFFWPLAPGAPPPPTTDDLRAGRLGAAQRERVATLRAANRFFHWPLEFPEVFERGGFDCVLGNPPWERIKLQEEEFFAERDPEIAKAANKAARQRLIEALPRTNPGLAAEFAAAKRAAEAQSKFIRASGRFPLTAVGDVNLYALFAEHNRDLINARGRAGVIAPTGIATDDSTKRFFQSIVDRAGLASLVDFENRAGLFPDVDSRMKFCLLTLSGAPVERGDFAFFCTSVEQLRDERRRFQLSPDDFALLNPNTRTCPVFRTALDAELTRAIYRRVPVLVDERTGANPWGIKFLAMFHMSNDSHLFHTTPAPDRLPLYEAKLSHHFNHRWATYEGGDARDTTPTELADPTFAIRPRYWVDRAEVTSRLQGRWNCGWLLPWRDIARATDERTFIASVVPRLGTGHNAPLMFPHETERHPQLAGALLGCINSLAHDFAVRQKIGGTHLTYHFAKQFPVLPPSAYSPADLEFIVPRVLELTYTAHDLAPFACDCGYDGPPFPWDQERRALLRAELDAYYAALYGLTRDELRYILDPHNVHGPDFPGETFRTLKERELRELGEFRTRRLVLEAWDRLGLAPRNRDGRYDAGVPPAGPAPGQPPTDRPGASTNGRAAGQPSAGRPSASPASSASGGATAPAPAARHPAPPVAPTRATPPPSQSLRADPPRAHPTRATPSPATTPPAERPRAPVPPARALRDAAPPAQPPLPGVIPPRPTQPVLPGIAAPSPQSPPPGMPAPDEQLRQRVLTRALELLRGVGPLSAREIAARLAPLDARIDKRLVNSLLYHEGKPQVRHDPTTGKYRAQ